MSIKASAEEKQQRDTVTAESLLSTMKALMH